MNTFEFALFIFFFSMINQFDINAYPNLDVATKDVENKINLQDTLPQLMTNCPFIENNNDDGFINEDEFEVMQHCLDNRIIDAGEISNNLVGLWDLVGHGEGWLPGISQPCSNIEITESNLIFHFQNEIIDTITTHNWVIVDDTNYPYLEITPPLIHGERIGIFCENYMFADATPVDGNMYLYQKNESTSNSKYDLELTANPIRVFPNPTTGVLKIESSLSFKKLNSIRVYDIFGKSFFSKYSDIDGELISLDLTSLAKGTYFLVLEFEGNLLRQKIILF